MGTGTRDHCDGVVDGASRVQSSSNDHMEASGYDNENAADTVKQSACQEGEMENSCDRNRQQKISAEEEVWEEYGCVLWDLATSRTHAELMVLKLLLFARVSSSVACFLFDFSSMSNYTEFGNRFRRGTRHKFK